VKALRRSKGVRIVQTSAEGLLFRKWREHEYRPSVARLGLLSLAYTRSAVCRWSFSIAVRLPVFSCQDFYNFFSLGDKLGQGLPTCSCFKGTAKRQAPDSSDEQPTVYAIKRARKRRLKRLGYGYRYEHDHDMENEVVALALA